MIGVTGMTADFVYNKDTAGVPPTVWFSSDLLTYLCKTRQREIEDNYKSPLDIVYIYFRSRCYLDWLHRRLAQEKRRDHIKALEYHKQTTERRLDWLQPYVLPSLQFVDDPVIRARCVRMILDFDASERCDTYTDPDFPDSTDPYSMHHPYNPELMPALRDLPHDVYVDVGFFDQTGIVRPSIAPKLPAGYRMLSLPSGDYLASKE